MKRSEEMNVKHDQQKLNQYNSALKIVSLERTMTIQMKRFSENGYVSIKILKPLMRKSILVSKTMLSLTHHCNRIGMSQQIEWISMNEVWW